MPIIGVPCRVFERSFPYPPLHGHHETYIQAIEKAEGAVILIPRYQNIQTLEQIKPMLDGLLLAGGGDVDPSLYQEAPHPTLGEVDLQQDRLEIELIRWAMAQELPILAICRGIQILNVALGGSLYQDIPTQLTTPLNHSESDQQQNRKLLTHTMQIQPTSQLAGLINATSVGVNSLHHQAIQQLGSGITAVGWAEDGLIEAVEGTNTTQWLMGVQCHPEELAWASLFDAFIEASTRWRKQHE